MPILAGEEDPTQHQVASRTPKSRHSKKCSKCSSCKHRSKQCLLGLALITSTLGQERMTLAERLALMDKPDWAPALCKKCFRHNPGHMELDCPQYKQCQRCYHHGSHGFVRRHACGIQAEENEDMSWDDGSWLDLTWVCCSWRRALYHLLILARLRFASLQCSRSLVQTTARWVSSSQVGDK